MVLYIKRGGSRWLRERLKNKQRILDFLKALWLLAKLAIIHCLGHKKGDSPAARGNQWADKANKVAAEQAASKLTLKLPNVGPHEMTAKLVYTLEDFVLIYSQISV